MRGSWPAEESHRSEIKEELLPLVQLQHDVGQGLNAVDLVAYPLGLVHLDHCCPQLLFDSRPMNAVDAFRAVMMRAVVEISTGSVAAWKVASGLMAFARVVGH